MQIYVVLMFLMIVYFFFFKQKTAYEMRISDWSSDVCSSDLVLTANSCSSGVTKETRHGEHTSSFARRPLARTLGRTGLRFRIQFAIAGLKLPASTERPNDQRMERTSGSSEPSAIVAASTRRTEERRVGKEGVRTGRSQ